jgi:hypothetical protein
MTDFDRLLRQPTHRRLTDDEASRYTVSAGDTPSTTPRWPLVVYTCSAAALLLGALATRVFGVVP